MKKLIYVLARRDYFARGDCGRVTHALGVAEGFAKNGWTVEIISGPKLKSYQECLPDIVSLKEINSISSNDFIWALHLFSEFNKSIKKGEIQIFIVRYAVKKILLCWLMCAIAKKKGVISVVEINSFAFHHRILRRIPFVKTILKKAEIIITSKFDLIYSVSASLTKTIKEVDKKANVVTIPNASSVTVNSLKINNINIRRSKLRFVYLGSLHSYYDFEFLLSAYSQLPESLKKNELHFYGSGEMENKLMKIAHKYPNIVFHGIYKRNDIGKLVDNQNDILVLPPNTQDRMEISGGLSTKLFEYLSLRIPIIAPAASETDEILVDKVNAILYDHKNSYSLTEALTLALSDSDLRKKTAANAFRDFINNHTWYARMLTLSQSIYNVMPKHDFAE